MSNYSDETEMS